MRFNQALGHRPGLKNASVRVKARPLVGEMMRQMKSEEKIIPWKCHLCGKEFKVTSGGICSKCNKPTCNKHLGKGSFSMTDQPRVCTQCRPEEPIEEQKKSKRTKFIFITIASFLAVHSAVIAGNILRTGQISPYSEHGLGALSTHVISFIGLSLLVLTVKQKLWRTGGILAALSALSRSCATSLTDQKVTFSIITIIVSLVSISVLAASFRLETFDLSQWERGRKDTALKLTFALLIILVIVGIFIYWSRG